MTSSQEMNLLHCTVASRQVGQGLQLVASHFGCRHFDSLRSFPGNKYSKGKSHGGSDERVLFEAPAG